MDLGQAQVRAELWIALQYVDRRLARAGRCRQMPQER